jgi:hypothetical protein
VAQVNRDLKDKDEAVVAAIDKLKEIKTELEAKRSNIGKFLRKAYYCGLRLMLRDRKPGEVKRADDAFTLFYNNGSSDKVETRIIKSNEYLDQYCGGIMSLIEGKEIEEKVNLDEGILKIKGLL